MTPAEFEDRLHDLLDARADPLADPACAAFLAEHPGHLEALARLVERCDALPAVALPDRLPRWRGPMPWLLLAAAAATTVLLVRPGAPAQAAAPAASRPAGRVLAAFLQPIRPTLQVSTPVRAHAVLLAAPAAQLEIYQQWSTP